MYVRIKDSNYPLLRITGILLTGGSVVVCALILFDWILTMSQNGGILEPFPPKFGIALMGVAVGQISRAVADMADRQLGG